MRILVDISETAFHGQRTGIQRVVREVTNRAGRMSNELGVEIIPVIANGACFYGVQDLQGVLNQEPWLPSGAAIKAPQRIKWHIFSLAKRLLDISPPLARLARRLLYWRSVKKHFSALRVNNKPLKVCDEDVLLMLDSFWLGMSLDAVINAQRDGAVVMTMIYDLIPISHPQLCGAFCVSNFKKMVEKMLAKSEHVLTISDFCKHEINSFCAINSVVSHIVNHVDYVHLGSDFRLAEDAVALPDIRFPANFFRGDDVFVMIGTIEPRKNHAFVLDAFEQHWSKGGQSKLLWVGTIGWDVDRLVERTRASKYFGERFFVIHDATDAELASIIKQSSACIQASTIEGFGLPLVEAMQAGLPVIASDIPVLREIGGGYPLYFSLDAPSSLMNTVAIFKQTKTELREKLSNFYWQTWDEASEKLYRKVIELHQFIKQRPPKISG